jgi:PPK2 family polyphosphate:nucleotide phosphotransferase
MAATSADLAAPIPPLPADFAGGIDRWPTTPPKGTPTGRALAEATEALLDRVEKLQGALMGEGRRSLLLVLQARDAGGKDGTIRKVFGALQPQGVRVTSFRAPVGEELTHDFLWRVHREVPGRGMVGVFNRSHYEDVLAVRVRQLAPEAVWRGRYAHINAFERLLTDAGTTIVKLFLHVSRAEQARRLRARLEDPAKNWKFNPGDIEDRARWDDYSAAYDDVFRQCNTPEAPWWVVPADDKKARDYVVAGILHDVLERMAPAYPRADPEVLGMLGTIV